MAHATILLCIAILVFVPSTLSQKSNKSEANGQQEQSESLRKHYYKIRCLVNPQACEQELKDRNRLSKRDIGRILLQAHEKEQETLKRSKRDQQPCFTGMNVGHCENQMMPHRPLNDPINVKDTGTPKNSDKSKDHKPDTKHHMITDSPYGDIGR